MFCSRVCDWVCRADAFCITVCAVAKSDWMSEMVCCPACGVRLVAVRWLSAEICASELAPVGDAVNAAYTAIDCNCERIADSLACAPYCTVTLVSIRAVSEPRAEGLVLPVYQATVLAEPLTRDVAELKGEPDTRSGGGGAVTVL